MPTTWITSAEAFGTPTLTQSPGVVGIPSAEAFGTAVITHSSVTLLSPSAIPSAEAVGTPTLMGALGPVGIVGREAFGALVVTLHITDLLCSATARGHGTMLCGNLLTSGVAHGTGSLNAATPILIHILDPDIFGFGTLTWNGPLHAVGHGSLHGFLDVTHILSRCPPTLPTFRWMQQFQLGDLELFTTDDGLPYSPAVCLFALYRVLPGGVRILVGDPNRRPAQQNVGHYYVTGTAGECGQPGEWVVQWRTQRFWNDQPTITELHFNVQDAVAAGPPDPTLRSCKKGWL